MSGDSLLFEGLARNVDSYGNGVHNHVQEKTIMRVISATSARANFFGLIDQVTDEHEEVMITTKRKNAVLVSEEDWRSMQETLYLTSIPGIVESVHEARKESSDQRSSLDEIRAILSGTDEDGA